MALSSEFDWIEHGRSAKTSDLMLAAEGAASRLMPDLADPRESRVISERSVTHADLPLMLIADNRAQARARVIERTAQILSSGRLGPSEIEGQVVQAAIVHQLMQGGVGAADSLGPAISTKLKDGMKLEIKQDREFEKRVRESLEREGRPVPDYIRVVQLRDKDGKLIGAMGIAVSVEKKDRGVLI